MPARLIESLATTEALADLFSDESLLQAALDFESALARAQARLGLVPQAAARAISKAAKAKNFDAGALSRESARGATLGLPLSKALSQCVAAADAEAARFVHWGATSQDVADTALVLLLKQAQPILMADLTRIEKSLFKLSEANKKSAMLGRTLLQPAPPVTFGLKAAGWLAAIRRSRERLEAAFADSLIVQLGGASGTLASMGSEGPALMKILAEELGLGCPVAPWHTERDRLAALVCACGVLTGALGKMARDISLLTQAEVAEAAERGGEGRGASSTMPHKQNPTGCVLTLAAANRVPGLVASYLSAMVQEHERAAGGWQSEWPTMASIVQATGLATASMAQVARNLVVHPKKMRANIEGTQGVVFSERAMMLLSASLEREAARKMLESAVKRTRAQGKHLREVLAQTPQVTSKIERSVLKRLEVPEQYLGSAEEFRQALISAAKQNKNKK